MNRRFKYASQHRAASAPDHWKSVLRQRLSQSTPSLPAPPQPAMAPLSVTPESIIPLHQMHARRVLTPIQEDGVAFLMGRVQSDTPPYGGLLCDDTRLGKTTMVLETWHRDLVRRAGGVRGHVAVPPRGQPTLVVVNKNAVQTWRDELLSHFNIRAQDGVPDAVTAASGVTVAVVILDTLDDTLHTADLALRSDLVLTTYSTLTTLQRYSARDALLALHYRFVFCDEAHVLVNEHTQAHHALAERITADAKFFVSATPMQNSPAANLAAALRLVGVPTESLDASTTRHWLSRLYLRRERVPAGGSTSSSTAAHAALLPVPIPVPLLPAPPQAAPGPVRQVGLLPCLLLDFATVAEARLYQATAAHIASRLGLARSGTKSNTKGKTKTTKANDKGKEKEKEMDGSGGGKSSGRGDGQRTLQAIHRLRRLCVASYLVDGNTLRCGDDISPPLPEGMELIAAAAAPDASTLTAMARDVAERGLLYCGLTENDDTLRQLAAHVRMQLRAGASTHAAAEEVFARFDAEVQRLSSAMLPPISAKERWICANLLNHVADPAGEKVVVFSNWKEPLERLANLLTLRRTLLRPWLPLARDHVYVHGAVTPMSERENLVKRFREDPSVGYMLVTLGCGGTSQDLSCANHVVLLDPWWNPFAEKQAADRIEGIKQRRPTHAYRLAMRGTIDEVVVQYADDKARIGQNLLSGVPSHRAQHDLLATAVAPPMSPQSRSVMSIDDNEASRDSMDTSEAPRH